MVQFIVTPLATPAETSAEGAALCTASERWRPLGDPPTRRPSRRHHAIRLTPATRAINCYRSGLARYLAVPSGGGTGAERATCLGRLGRGWECDRTGRSMRGRRPGQPRCADSLG